LVTGATFKVGTSTIVQPPSSRELELGMGKENQPTEVKAGFGENRRKRYLWTDVEGRYLTRIWQFGEDIFQLYVERAMY